ncbi:MAG TPA: hypothetical protein VFW65_06875 [Pseudonocardiaceae bacterium]|nr:hypothetical protein [Pseudonocardiaceae bacterium]
MSRATLFAVLLVATSVTGSACAVKCEGPVDPAPFVALHVKAWESVHPEAHLAACLASHCVDVPAGETAQVNVSLPSVPTAPVRALSLRLTATRGGETILHTTHLVRLRKVTVPGPCGFIESTRDVTLTAQGSLSVA